MEQVYTDVTTVNLSKFGFRELAMAGELLTAYANFGADFLGDGMTLNFNSESGFVFLSDEDFNVGIYEGIRKKVVQFYSCPMCGYEGTQEDAESEGKDFIEHEGYCSKSCEDENEGR